MPQEEVKIYGAKKQAEPADNAAERAAEEYRLHSENGNLARAHALGREVCSFFLAMPVEGEYINQQWVLLSYLVERLLQQQVPHALLCQSAESKFAETLQEVDPALTAVIHDSRAFTLYSLNKNRLRARRVGEIFAELCEHPGDEALIQIGETLAEELTGQITEAVEQAGFVGL